MSRQGEASQGNALTGPSIGKPLKQSLGVGHLEAACARAVAYGIPITPTQDLGGPPEMGRNKHDQASY